MKALCGLNSPIMESWGRAFKESGHQFKMWNPRTKSAFDTFDENEPDIFIGDVREVTRGVAKCLSEYQVPTALYSPEFSQLDEDVINSVKQLKSELNRPDLIFSFDTKGLDNWHNLGFHTQHIPAAADPLLFKHEQGRAGWGADIAYVGNYNEKAARFLLPLCHENKYRLCIFGDDGWPVINNVGQPESKTLPRIYNNTLSCLSFDKNDDSPFNAALCGAVCLTNYDNMLGLPTFETVDGLKSTLNAVLASSEKRAKYVDGVQKVIEGGHTYKDRVELFLGALGCN
jgi:hypothetical protein